MLVEDLLHYNPLRLICATPESAVSEAVERMAHYDIGVVVVIDDDNKIVGILSERDIVMGLASKAMSIDEAVVADLMTRDVVHVAPTDTIGNAVLAMNTHRIRHLLVVQAGKPVGVVSIRDVLRVFAKQLLEVQSGSDGDTQSELISALATG